MKKLFSLFIVLVILLSSCATSSGDDKKTTPLGTVGGTSGASDTSSSDSSSDSSDKPDTKLVIEKQVLYDKDNVKVTATGAEENDFRGTGVKVLLENNTDKDVYFQIDNLIVNDFMITNLFSASVPAGKKSNETIYFRDIEESGITKVGKIEMYMYVGDSESYDRIIDLGYSEIKTNLYDSMDGASSNGIELLNRDGVRVVGKYLNEDDFWGKSVVLYIENTTDKTVYLSVDDLSVNDFAFTSLSAFTVLSGKKMIDSITLRKSDLEDNNIETVEKVEFKLRSLDPETYGELFISDVITVIPQK